MPNLNFQGIWERSSHFRVVCLMSGPGLGALSADLSKNATGWMLASKTPFEVGEGYYGLDLSSIDTNQNGPLMVRFKTGGAQQGDTIVVEIREFIREFAQSAYGQIQKAVEPTSNMVSAIDKSVHKMDGNLNLRMLELRQKKKMT